MKDVILFLGGSMLCMIFLIGGALFSDSILNEEIKKDKYCELVLMWEEDEDQGLSEYDRAGHPNYKGVICEQ